MIKIAEFSAVSAQPNQTQSVFLCYDYRHSWRPSNTQLIKPKDSISQAQLRIILERGLLKLILYKVHSSQISAMGALWGRLTIFRSRQWLAQARARFRIGIHRYRCQWKSSAASWSRSQSICTWLADPVRKVIMIMITLGSCSPGSVRLNHVWYFLWNIQFFFFSSIAARYCWYVPC